MRVPIRKPGKYSGSKNDFIMTAAKVAELKSELDRLLKKSRPNAISEVKRLAELGDFSENAEYQIAKGRLRGMNARIQDLEEAIKKAKVISGRGNKSTVGIGHKVAVKINGQEKEYQVLGSHESDPLNGIISHASPLGQALLGRKTGENFEIKIGDKKSVCSILKIE